MSFVQKEECSTKVHSQEDFSIRSFLFLAQKKPPSRLGRRLVFGAYNASTMIAFSCLDLPMIGQWDLFTEGRAGGLSHATEWKGNSPLRSRLFFFSLNEQVPTGTTIDRQHERRLEAKNPL